MMKNTQDVKIRYRMYKKGKHWVFASITATSIAIGAFTFTGLSASAEESTPSETTTADETQTQPSETQVQETTAEPVQAQSQTTTTQPAQTQSQTTTTQPAQTQSQETTTQPAQTQSQTTTAQPAQAQSQETTTQPAQAQSQETTTQSAQAQSQETTTQPAQTQSQETTTQPAPTPTTSKKPTATVTKNVAKAAKNYATATKKAAKTNVTKAVAATPKPTSAKTAAQKAVAKTAAVTASSIPTEVTKENFNDAFRLNGSATYEKNDGVVTLTPNEIDKTGNFALKNKIDLSKSFTLEGSINLGNKSMSNGGADGIGFAFHNGNTDKVGMSGGALGIGNLVDAFGFKLDTFYNGGTVNGSKKEFFHGDPDKTKNESFGAFTYTKRETVPTEKGNSYSGSQQYYAYTDSKTAQKINHPFNNQFHDIIFNYNGDTKIMTIKYEGKEWTANINQWKNKDVDAYSFIVSGSTGGSKNLQQFKIKKFTYTAAGMFTALFKEEGTNTEIADKISKDGEQGKSIDVTNDVNTAFKKLYDLGYDYVDKNTNTDKQGEYNETKNADGTFSSINVNFDNTPSEVTYLFKKVDGSIIVNHVDQDGKVIENEAAKRGKSGEKYTTNDKKFDGYRFVGLGENSASANGTYTRGEQTIIYQYQATSVVDFLFLEKDDENNTTPIAESFNKKGDEKATEIVKEDVTKVLNDLYEQGYDLVDVTPDQENMYDKDTQTITYVEKDGKVTYTFEKAKGSIIVRHVDQDGKVIENEAAKRGKSGEKYTTNDKKFDGYRFVGLGENSAPANGTYTRGEQTIIYQYQATSVVDFLFLEKDDEDNTTPIADSFNKKGDEKATEIVKEDVTKVLNDLYEQGYDLVDVTPDQENMYDKDTQTITYVEKDGKVTYTFEKANGIVIVKYQDEAGTNIEEADRTPGKVGKDYSTTPKDIPGFTLIPEKTQGNTSGIFTRDEQTVIYVYQKDEQPAKDASLTVTYVDIDTNEVISPSQTFKGKEGDKLPNTSEKIPEYTFVKSDGVTDGNFVAGEQSITHYYKKIEQEAKDAALTVTYVDIDTNEVISPSQTLTGKEGDKLPDTSKKIPDYTFVKSDGVTDGNFVAGEQSITHYYKKIEQEAKDAALTVTYVDIDTNEVISPSQTLTGKEGDKLPDTSKKIPDYTFVKTDGVTDGNFVAGEQSITHYYKKIEQEAKDAALTVTYVDIDTNEVISPSQTLTGKEGDKLPDTSKKIPDYTFVKSEGVTDGNFVAGEQSITHYYKKIEQEAKDASLTVTYVDIDTNEVISPPQTFKGKEGDKIPDTSKKIPDYTFVKTDGVTDGNFVAGEQSITHYYKKDNVTPPVVTPPVVEPPVVEPPVVTPPVVEPPVVEPPVVEPPVVEPPVVEPPVVEPPVVEPPVVTPPVVEPPVVEPPVVEPPVVEPPVVNPPKETENNETPVTPPNTTPEEETTQENPPSNSGNEQVNKPSSPVTKPNNPTTVVQVSNPPKASSVAATTPVVQPASSNTTTLQNPAQASMLPQTGDAATQTGLMGGMLLAIGALAGVFGLRKRKADK